MKSEVLSLGPDHHLSPKEVVRVADREVNIKLSAKAIKKVIASRKVIERIVKEGRVVYGVTTGFGSFKNKRISEKDVSALQRNLIRSHSVGVGPAFAPEFVRAILTVRINSLVQGYSGIRPEVVRLACELLNKNIIPFVPSQGSVGSSGDLAPLSHIGLVLMGEGRAWYGGKLLSGKEALSRAGLKPIDFRAKEGLAWNNGTSTMTGVSAIAVNKAEELLALADLVCAMTFEAVEGTKNALDEDVHRLRPHPGQVTAARNIAAYLAGSRLVDSKSDRVQDSYSLRCSPQVHGAAREAFSYVSRVLNCELNSVTDNPLVFSNPDRVISGGNFHGEPVAIAMDTLGIAIAEIANISERRTAKLLDASTNEGLPMFLVPPEKAGLHNGLMIAQYTAAALVSENKVLAHPASVDSIPTSANQEDHVSMGTISARKAWEIVRNAENVLAIEFITAAQGIDFREQKKLGRVTKKAYEIVRSKIPFLDDDRELWKDVENMKTLFGDLLAITGKRK